MLAHDIEIHVPPVIHATGATHASPAAQWNPLPFIEDGVAAHAVGLPGGMVFIECLANLCELPPRGAMFVFLPLKVTRSSGAPGWAIALVPH